MDPFHDLYYAVVVINLHAGDLPNDATWVVMTSQGQCHWRCFSNATRGAGGLAVKDTNTFTEKVTDRNTRYRTSIQLATNAPR